MLLSNPWYALVVIIHVLVAVIGFGALGMTGAYARLVSVSSDPFHSPGAQRYFRRGKNIGARAIYLVPVFGGIALGFSHDTHRLFPYFGLFLWLAATGIASAMLWPAEAKIQQIISRYDRETSAIADREALLRLARRCERAAMATSLCFVIALVVMIAQPN